MYNPFNLKNRNIVITGASSGIGKQCAIECSKMGANLVIMGRNKERLQDTLERLEGDNHLMFAQDNSVFDKLEGPIKIGVEKLGKLSGLIHSAGIEITMPLKSMKPSKYNELFDVNVISGFELARIISKKKYLSSNGASFVFISSVMGQYGEAGLIGYCSSKGALIAGVKAMALELNKKEIRANAVSPGHVMGTNMADNLFNHLPEESKTKIVQMHPLGLGKTDDVALACVYLLSDAAKWITGISLPVDGGYCAK